MLEKYFKDGYNSFHVVCNIRHNNKLRSMDLIQLFAEMVNEINPLNFVDLKKAKYTILVEIVQRICCVSVITDFMKFRKYNLHEAASAMKPSGAIETVTAEPSTESAQSQADTPIAQSDVVKSDKTDENVAAKDQE